MRTVTEAFEQFCDAHHLPMSAAWPFQVAIDEVLSNTVRCGYDGGGAAHRIEVDFALKDGVLVLTVVDDAAAFNPLEVPEPDVELSLEERPLGGLGIHVLRKLMDEVAYERREGRNHLVLTRRIDA